MNHTNRVLNHREFEHALQLLGACHSLRPESSGAHYLSGVFHEMGDNPDTAYAAYRAALMADPGAEPAKLLRMKFFKDRIL